MINQQNPKQQLTWLWVNTQDIDSKVSSDIENTRILTKQEVVNKAKEMASNEWWEKDRALFNAFLLAKEKWYAVEWTDIDEMLEVFWNRAGVRPQQPTQPQPTSVADRPTVITQPEQDPLSIDHFPDSFANRTLKGAVSHIPAMLWNTASFVAKGVEATGIDKGMDYLLSMAGVEPSWKKVSDVIKETSQEDKEKLQKVLWVDPDEFATSLWEFLWEVWAMAAGGAWLLNRASKWQALLGSADDLAVALSNNPRLLQWLNNLREGSPRLYNMLSSKLASWAVIWWVEWAIEWVISEWAVSAWDVGIWATIGSAFGKVSDWVSTPWWEEAISTMKKK